MPTEIPDRQAEKKSAKILDRLSDNSWEHMPDLMSHRISSKRCILYIYEKKNVSENMSDRMPKNMTDCMS